MNNLYSDMKKILIISALAASVIMVSCEEDNVGPDEALAVSAQAILNDPELSELRIEYQDYVPDSAAIAEIKANLDSDEKLIVFVKPSCGCTGTQESFPRVLKVAEVSGIEGNQLEIFSMSKEENIHPYSSSLTIKDLPEFHIMKGGDFVYAVKDSMMASPLPDSLKRIETFMADGLKQ
jgi:hypothetical protein